MAGELPENARNDAAGKEMENKLQLFRQEYAQNVPCTGVFKGSTFLLPRQIKSGELAKFRTSGESCIARPSGENPSPREEFFLPFYVNESNLVPLEEKLLAFLEKGGYRVRVSSPYGFPFIKKVVEKLEKKNGKMENPLCIKTAMPLHVCNSFAVSLLASAGACMVQASPELGKTEMEELCRKSPLPVEIYVYGRPVLLGTRAALPVEGKMTDSRGEVFLVEKENILTLILPEKLLDIPVCKGAAGVFYDLRYVSSGSREQKKGRFNFDVSLA